MPIAEILKKLKKPFPDSQIYLKIQATTDNSVLLVKYLHHAIVQQRINESCDNWQFLITELKKEGNDFHCVGVLQIEDIKRGNAGEGNAPKGAASDCFKRCGVLFGIGLDLYLSGRIWVDIDDNNIFGRSKKDGRPYLKINTYKEFKELTGRPVDEEPIEEEDAEVEKEQIKKESKPKLPGKRMESDDETFQIKSNISRFCEDHGIVVAKARNYFDRRTKGGMAYVDADLKSLEDFYAHIQKKAAKSINYFLQELDDEWELSQSESEEEITDEPLPF